MSSSVSGATIEDNIEIIDAEQPHTHDEADVDGIKTNGDTKDRLYTTPNGDIKVKPLPYKILRTKRLVLNYICNIDIFYKIFSELRMDIKLRNVRDTDQNPVPTSSIRCVHDHFITSTENNI